MDFLVHLDAVFPHDGSRPAAALRTLYEGAGDIMGGLAQALTHHEYAIEDGGLRIVQLKRALRGAAFAHGAVFLLRSSISADQFDELLQTLEKMEREIYTELARVRSEYRTEPDG
jgi:hypothetical protein